MEINLHPSEEIKVAAKRGAVRVQFDVAQLSVMQIARLMAITQQPDCYFIVRSRQGELFDRLLPEGVADVAAMVEGVTLEIVTADGEVVRGVVFNGTPSEDDIDEALENAAANES